MMGLFTLSQYILAPILTEWITDQDVCSLDTAVCNHTLRPKFLSVLTKCSIVNTVLDRELIYEECIKWFLLRGFGLKRMLIAEGSLDRNATALLEKTKHLEYLESQASPELERLVSTIRLCVDQLCLLPSDSKSIEAILKTIGQSIIRFDYSSCTDWPDNLHSRILTLCPELQSISFPSKVDIHSLNLSIDEVSCDFVGQVLQHEPKSQSQYRATLKRIDTRDLDSLPIGKENYHLTGLSVELRRTTASRWGGISWAEMDTELKLVTSHVANLTSLTLKNLTREDLSRHLLAMQALLQSIALRCHSLQSFTAVAMDFRGDDLKTIFKNSPLLRSVEFARCEGVTDEAILIATQCPLLDSFTSKDTRLAEPTLAAVIEKCSTVHFTDDWMEYPTLLNSVAKNMRSLEVSVKKNQFSVDYDRHASNLCIVSALSKEEVNFVAVLSQNPTLQSLLLKGQEPMEDSAMEWLASLCPNLTSLSFISSPARTVEGLASIGRLAHLRNLHFPLNLSVSLSLMESVLRNKTSLLGLSFSNSTGYSSDIICAITRCCPELRRFELFYSDKITDTDVVALLNGCPRLNNLNLEGCQLITGTILQHLKSRPMRIVNLASCSLNPSAVESFVKKTGFSCSCSFKY